MKSLSESSGRASLRAERVWDELKDRRPEGTSFSVSLVDRGQWEHEAAHTVQSLVGYAVGLSVAAAAITLFLAYRRSRRPAAARS